MSLQPWVWAGRSSHPAVPSWGGEQGPAGLSELLRAELAAGSKRDLFFFFSQGKILTVLFGAV